MATPGEETKKLARDVGQRSVTQLEAGLARVMGETGANNRWLLGALVLLNGGGIAVAAGETAWLDPKILESAISLLAMGAALAVLGALANAASALLLSRQIGAASALWTEVASSGEVSEPALKAAGRVRQTGQIASLVTPAIGFLSLLLFVGGVLTLASGLAADTTADADEPAASVHMNVGTPPLPASAPEPATPSPEPAPAATPSPTPTPTAVPDAKAPPPKPEPKRTPPRAAPRTTETTPAPSSAPAATSPPAAPAPTQPAPTPSG